MKKVYSLVLCVLVMSVLSGCNGLKRGIDGNAYVSTAKPAFALTVPALPLRTGGQFTAYVTSDDSLGGIPVQAWMAVYGGQTIQQPMAIVAQAEVPSIYYWDSDLYKNFSINHSTAVIGSFEFQACTYILSSQGDAFTSLVNTNTPNELRWIVRRYATRTDFNSGKITLEYREQLPSYINVLTDLPHGAITFIQEFEARAQNAFVFENVPSSAVNIQNTFLQGVETRYLNTNFFGTMSMYDISQ